MMLQHRRFLLTLSVASALLGALALGGLSAWRWWRVFAGSATRTVGLDLGLARRLSDPGGAG
jgi:asparagine N-glycosylation enzyme membrane subunit Stt3